MARIISSGLPSFVTPDRANLRIGINSTAPSHFLDVRGSATGAHVLRVQNDHAAGYSSMLLYDNAGPTIKGAFGYGNASASAAYAGRLFASVNGVDFTVTDGTTHFLYVDRANARIGIKTATPGDTLDVQGTLAIGTATPFKVGASGQVGFFGTAVQTKQTSGANLTNNITSGGTDDTITNWTDLTTYATDAAAIRNAVYQLSRKLKQINDGLRTYGLFT